jgi:hypothetical protein
LVVKDESQVEAAHFKFSYHIRYYTLLSRIGSPP